MTSQVVFGVMNMPTLTIMLMSLPSGKGKRLKPYKLHETILILCNESNNFITFTISIVSFNSSCENISENLGQMMKDMSQMRMKTSKIRTTSFFEVSLILMK